MPWVHFLRLLRILRYMGTEPQQTSVLIFLKADAVLPKRLNMQNLPNSTKPKVAVVGVGYWGKNLVRNFHELGSLAALCDEDESVAKRCRSEYAAVSFCTDFSAVLSDPSIAAVALATPATTHYEMVKAALEA